MRVDGFVPVTGTTVNTGADVLSKLKPGDTVRAQVLENSGNELTLKLADGSKVSASAMTPVNASDGEFVNFVYKGTVDGKPVLEVANQNAQLQVDTALDNIKNTLTALKLPVTDRNIELAKALKEQNVPVTADSMTKIMDLVSKNTDLKPDAAAFLTAANMSADRNNIEKLQNLLAGRLKISNDISELVKLINSDSNSPTTAVKSTIINSILEKLAAEVLSKGINQTNGAGATNKTGVPQNANANNATAASPITITSANNTANTNNTVNTNSATGTANTTNSANSNLNNAAISTSSTNSNNLSSTITETNSSSNATTGSTANNTNSQAANNAALNNAAIGEANNSKINNIADNITASADNKSLINSHANNASAATRANLNNLTGTLVEGASNQTAANPTDSYVNGSSNNNSSSVAEQISNLLKGGMPLGSADLPLLRSLNSQLESMVSRGDMSTEEQSAAKLIAKEIGVTIFKIQGKEAASDQVSTSIKNLKSFEDAVNNLKTLFVKIDQNSDEINPVKLYKNMDAALQTLKSSINQLPMAMQETAMNIANNLESNVNFINQLNSYSSYVQIPLSIFNQNTTGELYMLKKGSKSKKLDPSKMTILISLDSNNIGRIDTLLSVDKKNISTNFRLESSKVFEVLRENHKQLYTSLLEKGYRLVDFTYRLMDEPINIVNFEAEAKKEFIKSPNNIDILI
ncbi:MAG: flagellar hook-length control protein FliK [Ruminiclostridium sp.]